MIESDLANTTPWLDLKKLVEDDLGWFSQIQTGRAWKSPQKYVTSYATVEICNLQHLDKALKPTTAPTEW